MLEILLALGTGFYFGGALVTSIVTKTIDEVPVKWYDTLMLATLWPIVLWDASQMEEEP